MRRPDSVLGVGGLGEEAKDLYMGVAEKRGDEIYKVPAPRLAIK